MTDSFRLAILGAGNIGTSIARGLVQSGHFSPSRITFHGGEPICLRNTEFRGSTSPGTTARPSPERR